MQIIVFDHFNVSHEYTAIILSNLDTKEKLHNNWQFIPISKSQNKHTYRDKPFHSIGINPLEYKSLNISSRKH